MNSNQKGYTLFELVVVLGGVALAGMIVAAVLIAIHFISKWW